MSCTCCVVNTIQFLKFVPERAGLLAAYVCVARNDSSFGSAPTTGLGPVEQDTLRIKEVGGLFINPFRLVSILFATLRKLCGTGFDYMLY